MTLSLSHCLTSFSFSLYLFRKQLLMTETLKSLLLQPRRSNRLSSDLHECRLLKSHLYQVSSTSKVTSDTLSQASSGRSSSLVCLQPRLHHYCRLYSSFVSCCTSTLVFYLVWLLSWMDLLRKQMQRLCLYHLRDLLTMVRGVTYLRTFPCFAAC